jgi:hypothetical protein
MARQPAEYAHRAGGGLNEPKQHSQSSGFACAIGSEEAINLASAYQKIKVIHRDDPTPVALGEATGFNHEVIVHMHTPEQSNLLLGSIGT